MFELPADAREPELLQLFDYWRSKTPAGRLPGRQHIDPVELPPALLPRLLLFDVDRSTGALRFRFRVAGTAFAELHGKEVTGQYYDEIAPPARAAPVIDAMSKAVETRRPVCLAGPLSFPSDRHHDWVKRLCLPLAGDGETVDMIIATFVPVPRIGARPGFAEPGEDYLDASLGISWHEQAESGAPANSAEPAAALPKTSQA